MGSSRSARKRANVPRRLYWVSLRNMVDYDSSTEDWRDLDKNDAGRHLIIVLTIFVFFDCVFIGIRFYARHVKKRYLELNDWAILVGFVSADTTSGFPMFNGCRLYSSSFMPSRSFK